MIKSLDNTKIHIPTEEDKIEAQEIAFKLGWIWVSGRKEVYEDSSFDYLFFASNKKISKAGEGENNWFEAHPNQEINLVDMRRLALKHNDKERIKDKIRIAHEKGLTL